MKSDQLSRPDRSEAVDGCVKRVRSTAQRSVAHRRRLAEEEEVTRTRRITSVEAVRFDPAKRQVAIVVFVRERRRETVKVVEPVKAMPKHNNNNTLINSRQSKLSESLGGFLRLRLRQESAHLAHINVVDALRLKRKRKPGR